MISGTSKIPLNLDPINGQIWNRGPRIYGFYSTKILQEILKKYMGTFWKNIIFGNLRIKIFEDFGA